MDNLELQIKQIISNQLGVAAEDIKNNASFTEDLNADSLDNVELVMALEHTFDFVISDDDAEGIKTVQDVIDYVKKAKGIS